MALDWITYSSIKKQRNRVNKRSQTLDHLGSAPVEKSYDLKTCVYWTAPSPRNRTRRVKTNGNFLLVVTTDILSIWSRHSTGDLPLDMEERWPIWWWSLLSIDQVNLHISCWCFCLDEPPSPPIRMMREHLWLSLFSACVSFFYIYGDLNESDRSLRVT